MAIYYSRLSLISRSRGHTATAAAAYRAGERIEDVRTELAYDYTRRKGVLDYAMRAPKNAAWALDLTTVWNKAEAAEVRRNGRTGRELVVALPAELTEALNIQLAHRIGQDLVDRYAVAVLVAVHGPDDHGDDRNVHAHFLMSTRVAGPDGFEHKVRILDDRKTGPLEAVAMRAGIAGRINAALEKAGYAVRVDERRLDEQADEAADRGNFNEVVELTRTPTKHQGRVATAMARRGETSVVVTANARTHGANRETRAFGMARAAQLRGVAARRGERWTRSLSKAKGAPTARRQALRHGAGPVNAITRATGSDAALLNDQAQLAREAAQGARNESEAYLQNLLRLADDHDRRLSAYFERIGNAGAGSLVDRSRPTASGRTDELLRRVEEAHAAYEEARTRYEESRRLNARAQAATAAARRSTSSLSNTEPSVWRPMTRRRWAEHRRRQRAALVAVEGNEGTRAQELRAAHAGVRARHAQWRRAHLALAEHLTPAAVGSGPRAGDTPALDVAPVLSSAHSVDDAPTRDPVARRRRRPGGR